MGRPPSDLDEYLDWQERLESFQASGLTSTCFASRKEFLDRPSIAGRNG